MEILENTEMEYYTDKLIFTDDIQKMWICPELHPEDEPRLSVVDVIFSTIPHCQFTVILHLLEFLKIESVWNTIHFSGVFQEFLI